MYKMPVPMKHAPGMAGCGSAYPQMRAAVSKSKRWEIGSTLTWTLENVPPANIMSEYDICQAVDRAFKVWSNATNLHFEEVTFNRKGDFYDKKIYEDTLELGGYRVECNDILYGRKLQNALQTTI